MDALTAYEITTLAILMAVLFNIAIVLAYRRRAAPWHAKVIREVVSLFPWAWLYFRIWHDVPRSWWGAAAFGIYFAGLVYYAYAYRKAPYASNPTRYYDTHSARMKGTE